MPHLEIRPKPHHSSFRKMAIGTWKTVGDPTVYGSIRLRMDKAIEYLEEYRRVTGKRLTMTHMVGKAVAHMIESMPDANAFLRFNRIYLRDKISVFFQVALQDEKTGEFDLSGTIVHDANKKSLDQFVDAFTVRTKDVREGNDQELEKSRGLFKKIPFMLLGTFLKVLSILLYALNLDMRWAGLPRDPFGSVLITNIGSLGLEEAYVPLVPYTRVPLLLAMGALQEAAFVKDGEQTFGHEMRLFATFDHRILDGAHAAKMASTLRQWFEDPYTHFGPIPTPVQATEESAA